MSRAVYNNLFRELFPEEWRAFARERFAARGPNLAEILAEDETEWLKITNDAPPIEEFCSLMEKYYFPVPEFWMEVEMLSDGDDQELDEFLYRSIPIDPFFTGEEFGDDPHILKPVFQVLCTLNGEAHPNKHDSKRCGKRCELRAIFILACNEIRRVDRKRLEAACRKEAGPLKHLALAAQILQKTTGNIWFDFDYEMHSETGVRWERENVLWMAKMYGRAEEDLSHLYELNNWFAKDMRRIREASVVWRKAAVL